MNKGFINVPFKTESGLSSINGIAKFSAAGIVLEFESKLFGLLTDGVKEARIPITDLLDIKFRKGVLKYGCKIEIRTNTFTRLAELPNRDGKLTLKLSRGDWQRGKEAVEQTQNAFEQNESERPPPQTPVSKLFGEETEDRFKTKELD